MSKKETIEWTEAHKREAWARLIEIHVEKIRTSGAPLKNLGMREATAAECVGTEDLYRGSLDECRIGPTRIDREVRRVDALATGQLVREPFERFETRRDGEAPTCHREWRGEDGAVDYAEYRNKMLDKLKSERPRWRAVRVRVTRIRRAK